jgi:acetylornithine deacetylase/succinyl-diaminopimelate desuccinylase-like protein
MRPKVEACIRAATSGVERTHIIDGRGADALLLGGVHRGRPRHHDRRPEGEGDLSWRRPRRLRSTLLHELVAIPSVSGDEEPIARFIETTVRGWGLDVVRDTTGVKVELRARKPGPTLALVSHVDVVPPGRAGPRDPWTPVVENGPLYGRGSGDAKASVAAMLTAMRDVAEAGGPAHGRLL